MGLILDLFLVSISILMLWKGADWLVDAASEIAHSLKISDLVIGLTVVAFGTSAPEFAVTIRAAETGQIYISLGYVVGSKIFKLGLILGGYLGVKLSILALYMSFAISAVIVFILLGSNLIDRKAKIPFGPYLAAGTLIALFTKNPYGGNYILNWYYTTMFCISVSLLCITYVYIHPCITRV